MPVNMHIELDEQALAQLGRSTEVRGALLESAEAIAKEGQRIAEAEAYRSGDYMRGIGAAAVGLASGELSGQVQAKDWKSNWVEFGTVNTPARAVLRRAAEALGYRPEGGRS